MKFSKNRCKTLAISISLLIISIWHHYIPSEYHFFHGIYQLLYIFPIIFSGIYFGTIGGIIAPFMTIFLSIPHFIYVYRVAPFDLYESSIVILIYFLVGFASGKITDKMRKEQKNKEELFEILRKTEKLTTIGEIAYIITHELKTPISTISGALELILHDKKLSNADEKYFNIIKNQITRMNDLTNKTLSTFREGKVEKSAISIISFFNEVQNIYNLIQKKNNIKLEIFINTKYKYINISHELFIEVFSNLIDNSINSIDTNGTIKITVTNGDSNILLEIADNGKGMSSDELKKIFVPFYTTSKTGMGLGVPIVKRIIELHEGQIKFKSDKNIGTQILITIPLNEEINA